MARKPSRSFDVDLIRQASAGRWAEILASIGGLPVDILDGKHHPCPWCGGKDRFRLINATRGACLCNQCFRSKNGDGIAVLQKARGWTFQQAIAELSDYLGIVGKHQRKIDPAEHLEWLPWSDLLIDLWCQKKRPIQSAAVKKAGGRLARYRGQWTVIALPVWGPELDKSDPVGWCLYNVSGGTLPRYAKGQPVGNVKVKLTYGSRPGLIGLPGDASTIWKTEGPTDLMALLSILPDGVSAVCNAMGAGEDPVNLLWVIDLLCGRTVYVCHDCDIPGQHGALGEKRPGWATAISTSASECRNVVLPYPIDETHGKDLRDWLSEGHTYSDLLELVGKSQVIRQANDKPVEILRPIESDDDPHRLARVNLERYATATGGRTLRYWRDQWYVWKDNRYREITAAELRAKLSWSIKQEFDRVAVDKLREHQEQQSDKEPPTVQRVTIQCVSATMQATSGMVTISSDVPLMTWLPTRERRRYIALQDGILDIERLLSGHDDCRISHTPEWFSTVCLPYRFDPEARCPKWEAMLEHNLEMDPERIKLLQEWAGYLLTVDSSEQKFLVCEGEGANGKSVFVAGLTAMLGQENVSNVSLEVFGDRFSRTDTMGKLLNAAADCGELDRVAEGYIKSFASGDRMYFDRKNLTGINCAPTAKLMICANNRPRLSDKSDGIWRRMLLVPWRVKISDDRRIKGMDKIDFWQESGELPGIFRWALAGLYRLRSQGGFTKSRLMDSALAEYQEETNPTRGFLREHLEISSASSIRASELYRLYKLWCNENGYHHMSEKTFGKEVKRVFHSVERKHTGSRADRIWIYSGISFSVDKICGENISEHQLF